MTPARSWPRSFGADFDVVGVGESGPGVEAYFDRSDTARVEEAKEASVVDDVDVVGVGRMGGIQGHALTDAVGDTRVVQTLDHGASDSPCRRSGMIRLFVESMPSSA